MLTKRNRKCARCGCQSRDTRTFPAKPYLQKLWVLSLGLCEDETARELESIRSRLRAKEDIRWCDSHFDQSGLPLKKRMRLDKGSTPVDGQEDEGEEAMGEGMIHHSTDDVDWHSGIDGDYSFTARNDNPLDGETSLHPMETSSSMSALAVAPLSLSQLDLQSSQQPGIDKLATYRSNSAISSVPTIAKMESSYRPSFNSQPSETEQEDEEKEEEEHNIRANYFLMEMSKLESLFRRCQECGGLIDKTSMCWKQIASAISVTYQCMECKVWSRWDSQPKKGKGRSMVYELNQAIPVAAFVTGTPIPRVIDFFELLRVGAPSDRSMRDSIRHYACPSIDRVYSEWENDARTVSKLTAAEDGIVVALDGQFDSPGFCASNCKVAAFDSSLRLIIAAVSLSITDPGIEGKSCRMESHGSEKVLEQLVDEGFTIKTRVTDSNAMVDSRLRANPKLQHIETQRDFWHVQKPMRKEWWKGMKNDETSQALSLWYKSFFNHLYYINEKYPKREDRALALEYVRSFIHHCTGKHKWTKGEQFKLVTKCNHSSRNGKKKGKGKNGQGKPKKAQKEPIKVDSPEYEIIKTMLFSPRFEKAFLISSSDAGTAMCECFHSMSLLYASKRFACSPKYYNKKMKLAVMHFNSLTFGELSRTRVEIGNCLLPRKGKIAISVKRKMTKGEHPWRKEILEESWKVRDDYEDKRFFKRIGAPDDDIYDVLKLEFDKMLRAEEQEEDEEDWDNVVSYPVRLAETRNLFLPQHEPFALGKSDIIRVQFLITHHS
ncbi:hypothetical protein PRIPAC_91474 [Pristionchus pacificus]|uniref:Uncharacterized protein n=2 Tax=Pristionchus pacificus TaxID=54126 RepID=A0A2A6BDH0_PRIPA|nr:hypothetical protein PRIPAC_91474 [Pristionchus pacificus]|eukprot:PDM63923.1 hypothetical protein PRIPAC_53599 [Pristionchus pacificus]